jgi:hypothetical protein
MTTAFSGTGTHPVTALVARFHDELDHLEATYWSMSEKELVATLPALTRLRQRVTSLELSVAHQADTTGLGTEVGAADTGAFWANAARRPKGIAKHRLQLAATLDKHPTTRDAMAAGNLAEDQAAVIVRCVDALPVMQAEAEAHLVGLAAEHDAKTLAILAKKVLETVAPDLADQPPRPSPRTRRTTRPRDLPAHHHRRRPRQRHHPREGALRGRSDAPQAPARPQRPQGPAQDPLPGRAGTCVL